MHDNTDIREEADYQEEFASLVNDALDKGGLTIADLARRIGVDRAALSRGVSGKRKLKYGEVVKISQILQIVPPSWNNAGVEAPNSRFLPQRGIIDAAVWRVKGSEMAEHVSPIRPINIEGDDNREQSCYFVDAGPYCGEYAVCVDVDDFGNLSEDDIVIVEEDVEVPGRGRLARLLLATVSIVNGQKTVLPLAEDGGPLADVYVKGLVIGFFRSTRKK